MAGKRRIESATSSGGGDTQRDSRRQVSPNLAAGRKLGTSNHALSLCGRGAGHELRVVGRGRCVLG